MEIRARGFAFFAGKAYTKCMRLLWLIVALCVGVPLGAVTIDWKTVDWGNATLIKPNESWALIPQGSSWAIRMSIPKTKLTNGSIKLRDANNEVVERGIFNVTKISDGKVSVDAWENPNGTKSATTLPSNYIWFEWQCSVDYSKLFSVSADGNYNELASWSSSLGLAPTEVCLFVSDADVVETALFLQVRTSDGVPEPSAALLFALGAGLTLLCRPPFRIGGVAER